MVKKIPSELQGCIMVLLAITFLTVAYTTFGVVMNITGLVNAPWLVVLKPSIIVLAIDLSCIVGAIVFVGGMKMVDKLVERLTK
jgi:hypothetical protein